MKKLLRALIALLFLGLGILGVYILFLGALDGDWYAMLMGWVAAAVGLSLIPTILQWSGEE